MASHAVPEVLEEGAGLMERHLSLDLAIHAMMGSSLPTDEVSLLFGSEEELDQFRLWAMVDCNAHNFASVPRDTMRRQDKNEKFDVRFEFLRLPCRPWRIEAMCILSGDAPLHREALRIFGSGCVFHLSYKVPDLDEYQTEVRKLADNGDRRYAEYQNSYGLFSYWRPERQRSFWPLLKPRVNLRDNRPVALTRE